MTIHNDIATWLDNQPVPYRFDVKAFFARHTVDGKVVCTPEELANIITAGRRWALGLSTSQDVSCQELLSWPESMQEAFKAGHWSAMRKVANRADTPSYWPVYIAEQR